jgi:hypothetical protein
MHLQYDPTAATNMQIRNTIWALLYLFSNGTVRKKEVINKIITEMQPPKANRRALRLLSYSVFTG